MVLRKKLRTWLPATLIAIVLAAGAYDYWTASWRPFDGTRWAEARYGNQRAAMYNDLVRRQLYRGMDRADIERKLGKADHEEDGALIYFSGHAPSLQIQLDSRGQYRGYELIGSD